VKNKNFIPEILQAKLLVKIYYYLGQWKIGVNYDYSGEIKEFGTKVKIGKYDGEPVWVTKKKFFKIFGYKIFYGKENECVWPKLQIEGELLCDKMIEFDVDLTEVNTFKNNDKMESLIKKPAISIAKILLNKHRGSWKNFAGQIIDCHLLHQNLARITFVYGMK